MAASAASLSFQRFLGNVDDDFEADSNHVFGSYIYIEPLLFFIAIICIVFVVRCIEALFEHLNQSNKDSRFFSHLKQIERELMIVGCTSFIFAMLLVNVVSLPAEWVRALSFTDVFVTLFSMFHCLLGLALAYLAQFQCKYWKRIMVSVRLTSLVYLLTSLLSLLFLCCPHSIYRLTSFSAMFRSRTARSTRSFIRLGRYTRL
jgi:ABC-type sugar transport system permease subunit